MPPGDPRNPCASHVKREGLGNGNSFIMPNSWHCWKIFRTTLGFSPLPFTALLALVPSSHYPIWKSELPTHITAAVTSSQCQHELCQFNHGFWKHWTASSMNKYNMFNIVHILVRIKQSVVTFILDLISCSIMDISVHITFNSVSWVRCLWWGIFCGIV